MPTHRVVFTPSGLSGDVDEGSTVLDAARRLGVDLDSVCGGRGICGRCQIEVIEGEHAKHGLASAADHLTAFSEPEAADALVAYCSTGSREGLAEYDSWVDHRYSSYLGEHSRHYALERRWSKTTFWSRRQA